MSNIASTVGSWRFATCHAKSFENSRSSAALEAAIGFYIVKQPATDKQLIANSRKRLSLLTTPEPSLRPRPPPSS